MGYNDRNPKLYESITGLDYGTDKPLDGSMPKGWEPPSYIEQCYNCKIKGDIVHSSFSTGSCSECNKETCSSCCKEYDDDEGGRYFWCSEECYATTL